MALDRPRGRVTIALTLFALALVVSQLVAASLPSPQTSVARVGMRESPSADVTPAAGPMIEVEYSIAAGAFDLPVRVLVATGSATTVASVRVYYDPINDFDRYGSVVPRNAILAGLVEDLRSEIHLRRMTAEVSVMGPTAPVTHGGPTSVIVIPSKVWFWEIPPPPVGRADFVSWVKRGGVLVILGRGSTWEALRPMEPLGVVLHAAPLAGWQLGDTLSSGMAVLTPSSHLRNELRWSYNDVRVAGEGAWVTHPLPGGLGIRNLTSEMYLRFRARIEHVSALELFYLELRDVKGDFAHYYVDLRSKGHQLGWVDVALPLAEPDRRSSKPIDWGHVSSISFVQKLNRGINMPSPSVITLGDIRLEMATPPVQLSGLSRLLDFWCRDEGRRLDDVVSAYRIERGLVVLFRPGIVPACAEGDIAHDIMQILQSGLINGKRQHVYADHLVPRFGRIRGTLRLSAADAALSVLFFSRDRYHLFYDLHAARAPLR